MPTIPTIKSLLQPEFNKELPPNRVFVMIDDEVRYLTEAEVQTIDNTFFFADMNTTYNIPTIQRKL